ncbi:MAG: hypothetical protein DCC71_06645 [Proteobacteria bacterium]|nr:MAG: hypothetical protein DCC71_06645 [Pseudomonadota bacterium]
MRGDKRFGSRSGIWIGTAVLAALVLASSALALQPEPEELPPIDEIEIEEPYAPVRVRDDHDPRRAAHPVRIVAYALHPVGVALDWLLVRPAVWAVRQEPLRTIFGYED